MISMEVFNSKAVQHGNVNYDIDINSDTEEDTEDESESDNEDIFSEDQDSFELINDIKSTFDSLCNWKENMVPINFWRNSDPFKKEEHFSTSKIDRVRAFVGYLSNFQ